MGALAAPLARKVTLEPPDLSFSVFLSDGILPAAIPPGLKVEAVNVAAGMNMYVVRYLSE